MRRVTFFVFFLVLLSRGSLNAADIQWDDGAGNNDWNNATNWAGNVLPASTDNAHINLSGANRAVFSTGTSSYNLIRVGDGSANGELLVTGGSLSSSSTTVTYIGASGYNGTVTVTNGTIDFGGYMLVGLSSGSTGTLNVAGGLLDSARNGTVGGVPSVSIGLGTTMGAQGNCYLSGGELRTRTGIMLGASGGTGRFEVDGGGIANVGTDNSADDGFWVQSANSVLAAYVTNNSLGSIYVAHLSGAPGTYSYGNVIFMPGSKLELGFHGATNAGSWLLMTWDGALLTNGLSLVTGTDTNWSFQFVTNGSATSANALRVTYIAANLSPPTGIVAVAGNGQAAVRWTVAPGATNYLLLRGTSAGGPYTVTNSIPAPASAPYGTVNFADTGLSNGVTYYYVVSAAITNGVTGNSIEVRATPYGGIFVHPGVMHAFGDLERMRTNVLAGNAPWYPCYTNFVADAHSSSAYAIEGPETTIIRDAVVPQLPTQFQDDCAGAYQNAILWYITGDPAHASRAIQILDAWSSTCTNTGGSDVRLACGLQGFKFITAAEIIRYTGAPWSATEITTCSNFIRTVILPQNRMYGGGNWGQCGAASAMAAGVFLEDEGVFNEAMNCIKYGAPTECDMGIMSYVNPLGWTDESDRDIGHWGLALDDMTEGFWTAWCQNVDMWTFLSNRLCTAHEYLAYFNYTNFPSQGLGGLTNLLAPYVAGSQCDGPSNSGLISQTSGAINQLGTWYDLWAQGYYPYRDIVGIAAPWSSNAVNLVSPTNYYDRDHVAFGNLVCALPPRTAGLPVMPSGLAATWSNAVVTLTWNSAAGATAYNVYRATWRGGVYTNIASAVALTNYADTTVANNVQYFYRVSATNAAGETLPSGLVKAYPSATVPAAPASLTATTTSHVRIDLAWSAVPGATSYVVARSTVSGGPYTPVAVGQGAVFLTYADTGLTPGTTYYYVVSATNSIGLGVNSAQASAPTLPALPSGWNYADAGYPTTPGNMTYTNGTFTVKGAGLDYGGSDADAFGFAYVNLTGDGTIIARVAARANYSGLHKSGVALRESLGIASKHAFVLCDGTTNNYMLYRSSTGGNGSSSGTTNITGVIPEWLKLTRAGNVFTGSMSLDGTNWTVLDTVSITMSNTLMAGFAVCSRNNGYLDTVTYDNVSVTGVWPALPGTPAGLAALPGDTQAMVAWSSATNATGYNVKRGAASNGPFAIVGTNLSSQAFTNTGLVDGALYYYVVSGTNFYGEGPNSSPVSVRAVSLVSPALNAAAAINNQMQFNWPTDHVGWELQVQTNGIASGLGTNWTTVPGTAGTNQFMLPVNAGSGSVFYRLTYP